MCDAENRRDFGFSGPGLHVPDGQPKMVRSGMGHDMRRLILVLLASLAVSACSTTYRLPAVSDAEIEAAMNGNICRCATYTRIKAAIKTAAG